ncbi:MAG: radical SAM protein [Deltaproteobacteria bacterium]|nr:radical SAM protein [Deltaproteobacteria bacterium]
MGAAIYPGVEREKLSIEVTTRCNSACLHCFARAGVSKHSSLPLNLAKKIIAEGYDIGYRNLHITGGEPLLWPGLFKALDYGFGLGYQSVSMNSNGTLLTSEICSRLAAYDCFSLSVSLEGPEALHNLLRGGGSYRRAIRGIDNGLEAGLQLDIFTTARKSLLPELPHFADDLFKKFPGISYLVLIQLICMKGTVFALIEELLEPEDFIRLVQTVGLLNLSGLRSVVKKNPLANVVAQLLEMPWLPPVPALYSQGSLIVHADRNISAVHSKRDSFGKYSPGVISKVLASDEYQKATGPDETICPRCQYIEACSSNGVLRPSEGQKDMQDDEPYCRGVLDCIQEYRATIWDDRERRKIGVCRKASGSQSRMRD